MISCKSCNTGLRTFVKQGPHFSNRANKSSPFQPASNWISNIISITIIMGSINHTRETVITDYIPTIPIHLNHEASNDWFHEQTALFQIEKPHSTFDKLLNFHLATFGMAPDVLQDKVSADPKQINECVLPSVPNTTQSFKTLQFNDIPQSELWVPTDKTS